MNNFISIDNNYVLEEINLNNDELTITTDDGVELEIKYTGNIYFFPDGNGAGSTWTDYNGDAVKLTVVAVDGYNFFDLESVKFNKEFVVEHIATAKHKYLTSDNGWD